MNSAILGCAPIIVVGAVISVVGLVRGWWPRWVDAWTRAEPEVYSVDHAARDLVAHARQHGRAAALGVVVRRSRRTERYSVDDGATTLAGLTEAEAVRHVSQVLRGEVARG